MAKSIELPPPQPATSTQFAPGQVWLYKTRPTEQESRVIIGKIVKTPEFGIIVHVEIIGLGGKNPSFVERYSSTIAAPITETALSESVTNLTDEIADLEGHLEDYNHWVSAYRVGHAGVYTCGLSRILEALEEGIDK